MGFPGGAGGKESACHCRRRKRFFSLWVEKIPWSRKWQPAPVFLPGKPHGQRSLVGYTQWGQTQLSDKHTHTYSQLGLPGGARGKESACQCWRYKRHRFNPEIGSGRSPEGGYGNSLKYSCLENHMDRGAWQATVHGIVKSQTQLSY